MMVEVALQRCDGERALEEISDQRKGEPKKARTNGGKGEISQGESKSKSKRERVVLSQWPRKGREILVVAKRVSSQTTQTRVTITLP